MSGFGIYSAGFGAFGLGTPLVAPDPVTGQAGSRWINPATSDYEVDPNTGQLKQMPATRQRVLLALMTLKGSASTVPRFGVNLPTKMGTTFESECKASVINALSHLTGGEVPTIRLNFITVERGRSSRARITVDWTDTTTGETDQVSTP